MFFRSSDKKGWFISMAISTKNFKFLHKSIIKFSKLSLIMSPNVIHIRYFFFREKKFVWIQFLVSDFTEKFMSLCEKWIFILLQKGVNLFQYWILEIVFLIHKYLCKWKMDFPYAVLSFSCQKFTFKHRKNFEWKGFRFKEKEKVEFK